jgi:hypothetical protein
MLRIDRWAPDPPKSKVVEVNRVPPMFALNERAGPALTGGCVTPPTQTGCF